MSGITLLVSKVIPILKTVFLKIPILLELDAHCNIPSKHALMVRLELSEITLYVSRRSDDVRTIYQDMLHAKLNVLYDS